MKQYLVTQGIEFVNTAPYTSQQNGKAERDNRTIVENARTMIQARNLPIFLWAEAVNTTVYVLNRVISSGTDKTPFEMTAKIPDVSHICVFGSDTFVHIDKQFRKKFDSKAVKMVLVGYQGDSTNYRLYNPRTKKVLVSRNVIFNERTLGEYPKEKEAWDGYPLLVEHGAPEEDEEDVQATKKPY